MWIKYYKNDTDITIIGEDMTYKRINITINPDTLKKLQNMAKEQHRTISNMITYLIEKE